MIYLKDYKSNKCKIRFCWFCIYKFTDILSSYDKPNHLINLKNKYTYYNIFYIGDNILTNK